MEDTVILKNFIKENKPLPSDYVVMDFETTGLSASSCHIIEVSILKFKNYELVEDFTTLINPLVVIPSVITNITGITNQMVQLSPTIEEILPFMIEFIGNNVIVGHNINFDLRFLKEAIYHNVLLCLKEFTFYYVDTLYLARKYLTNLKDRRLETLKNYYQIEDISHRAKNDCHVTNQVYVNILKEYIQI